MEIITFFFLQIFSIPLTITSLLHGIVAGNSCAVKTLISSSITPSPSFLRFSFLSLLQIVVQVGSDDSDGI